MTTGGLFTGDQIGCKAFLRSAARHYVYVLRRPDGRPFYVGKGCNDRVFHHENEARHPNDWRSNAHKLNVIRSIWRSGQQVHYEIDFVTDDEAVSLARESELITKLGRLHEGGPLTNLAAGGGSIGGPAPESREKHSATLAGIPDDNPERATLNGFVLSIARMDSVVLKPANQFVARPTLAYPRKTMSPSLRQTAALVASAAANGVALTGPAIIPRRVEVQGVSGLVENGVSNDIITSKLATLIEAAVPADEAFSLTEKQASQVVGFVGRKRCFDLGVIDKI